MNNFPRTLWIVSSSSSPVSTEQKKKRALRSHFPAHTPQSCTHPPAQSISHSWLALPRHPTLRRPHLPRRLQSLNRLLTVPQTSSLSPHRLHANCCFLCSHREQCSRYLRVRASPPEHRWRRIGPEHHPSHIRQMGSTAPRRQDLGNQSDGQESGYAPRLRRKAMQLRRKLQIRCAWRELDSQRVALVS
jgi:hypothetical protein